MFLCSVTSIDLSHGSFVIVLLLIRVLDPTVPGAFQRLVVEYLRNT